MPSATSPPIPITLPSPITFDFIPTLHALLARLPPSQHPTHHQHHQQQPATTTTPTQPNQSPLAMKDLPVEVAAIKLQIQKARVAIAALPDVERTLEEQEAEMMEVRGRIESLVGRRRALLEGIARDGAGRGGVGVGIGIGSRVGMDG